MKIAKLFTIAAATLSLTATLTSCGSTGSNSAVVPPVSSVSTPKVEIGKGVSSTSTAANTSIPEGEEFVRIGRGIKWGDSSESETIRQVVLGNSIEDSMGGVFVKDLKNVQVTIESATNPSKASAVYLPVNGCKEYIIAPDSEKGVILTPATTSGNSSLLPEVICLK